ncbi:HAD-superfamily subfamily IB hydrolase, TIGR01490 [Streptomyces sp. cf386]|nr:HAD family hydrolase [Streptomyces sp. cf386]SDP81071.1 HAD-superfamily subfamily IB hydrolase, TIGR01490 [Streptomyces sp. cf386]
MTDPQRPLLQRPLLVFSDVDETLINVKSMFDFLHYRLVRRHGTAGEEEYERIMAVIRRRAADGTPREDINRFYYRHYTGESVAEIKSLADDWFTERSASTRGFYIDSTRAALRAHRAEGATIVLVSGSFPPLLEPLAREVGADAVLCTRPRIAAGAYTGEVDTPVIGEGKRAAVLGQLAARPDVDPLDCYAYGDHISDLPMLELVGHPVVVGDDTELRDRLADRAARLSGTGRAS